MSFALNTATPWLNRLSAIAATACMSLTVVVCILFCPVLHPVALFRTLAVVPLIQRAHQITGNAADTLEGHFPGMVKYVHILPVGFQIY